MKFKYKKCWDYATIKAMYITKKKGCKASPINIILTKDLCLLTQRLV